MGQQHLMETQFGFEPPFQTGYLQHCLCYVRLEKLYVRGTYWHKAVLDEGAADWGGATIAKVAASGILGI